MPRQRLPNSDSGTETSRISSVIAIANTPSLNASIRPVSQRSLMKDQFHGSTAGSCPQAIDRTHTGPPSMLTKVRPDICATPIVA